MKTLILSIYLLFPLLLYGQNKIEIYELTEDIKFRIDRAYFDGEEGRMIFENLPVESLHEFARKLKSIKLGVNDRLHYRRLVMKYIQFEDSIEEPLKSEILNLIKERAFGTGDADAESILSKITMWWGTSLTLEPVKDPEIQAIVVELRKMANDARRDYLIAQGRDPSTILPYGVSPSPTPPVQPTQPSTSQVPTRKPTAAPKSLPQEPISIIPAPNSPANYGLWTLALTVLVIPLVWFIAKKR